MSVAARKTSHSRAQLVGVAILAFFVLALLFALTVQKKVPFRPYTYEKASFQDAGGLRVGDDVREQSVRVGQVSNVQNVNGAALVTMQINGGGKKIYTDATATLRARSSLGQTYVDLVPGSSGQQLASSGIPVSHTQSQVQLDDVLNIFNAPTRTAAGDDIKTVGDGFNNHAQDISDFLTSGPALLTNLGTVMKAAADPKTDLPALLASAKSLSSHLSSEESQLGSVMSNTSTTFNAFNPDAGAPLSSSIDDLPSTLNTADSAFRALSAPLTSIQQGMTAVQPAATELGQQTAEIRQTLRESTPTLSHVPPVAKQALPAVTSLTTMAQTYRPLAAPFVKGAVTATPFADTLAPYGTDAGDWFDWWSSALSQGDASGHWLRLDVYINYVSTTGNTGLADPTITRDPYPAAGTSANERAGGSN